MLTTIISRANIVSRGNQIVIASQFGYNLSPKHIKHDVIKWKHCRLTGPLCGEFTGHRWIPITNCAWTNGWANHPDPGHYDVTCPKISPDLFHAPDLIRSTYALRRSSQDQLTLITLYGRYLTIWTKFKIGTRARTGVMGEWGAWKTHRTPAPAQHTANKSSLCYGVSDNRWLDSLCNSLHSLATKLTLKLRVTGFSWGNPTINSCSHHKGLWEPLVTGGITPLRWRHNGRDCVSNHQPYDCLLHRLFRRRSK